MVHFYLFYIGLFLLLIPDVSIQASICSQGDEAVLVLEEPDSVIDMNVLSGCSKTMRTLLIRERKPRRRQFFASALFHFEDLETVVVQLSEILWLNERKAPRKHSEIASLSIASSRGLFLPVVGALKGFRHLKTLNLSRCNLTHIPPDLFNYSPSLLTVDLSQNNITHLVKAKHQEVTVDVRGNPITCNCVNSWLRSTAEFRHLPSCDWPEPCKDHLTCHARAIDPEPSTAPLLNVTHVNSYQEITLVCNASSKLPVKFAWLFANGLIPGPGWNFLADSHDSLVVEATLRPILQAVRFTTVQREQAQSSQLHIGHMRGALRGKWFCLARSEAEVVASWNSPLHLHVESTFEEVFNTCVVVGLLTMFFLLAIGIIGGTIRYLVETKCGRVKEPYDRYCSKTFNGVIPVPLLADEPGLQATALPGVVQVAYEPNRPEQLGRLLGDGGEEVAQVHSTPKGVADIALVFLDARLIGYYTDVLNELSRARLHPTPAQFHAKMEELRAKLCLDTGKGVIVQRDRSDESEQSGSAPSSSSAAPQLGRRQLTVRWVRDGIQSLSELCGGAGAGPSGAGFPFGQTITLFEVDPAAPVHPKANTPVDRKHLRQVAEFFF